MQRLSISLLVLFVLGSTAFAQRDLRSRLRLKSQVRYAGIYHYGLGTWTRPGAIDKGSELGPQFSTIYNNTCESPYFGAWYPGEYWTDEGRLPSTTSPDKLFSESQATTGYPFGSSGAPDGCPEGPSSAPGSAAGSADSYSIHGFQIGYCSNVPGTTSIQMQFRETPILIPGTACSDGIQHAPPPTASFLLTSLPGNAGQPYSCWVVSIDLSASSASFSMIADATGSYTNPPRSSVYDHLFTWTFTFPTNPLPTASAASGFFLAGNPANSTGGPNLPLGPTNSHGWKIDPTGGTTGSCAGYDGTVWDKHGANASPSMFDGGNNGTRGTFGFVAAPFGAGGNEDGTGMSTQDAVRIDNPTQNPSGSLYGGCFWFGGPASPATNPLSSFHFELYTLDDTSFVSAPGTGFCYGDGCAFTCPCTVGAIPDPQGHHESGCANGPSFGANIGSMLTTSGSANPFIGESVVLTCRIDFASPFQTPLALGVKGNARLENGAFPANNDGARCVDGALIRFGAHFAGSNGNSPGSWSYPTTAASETVPVSIRTGSSNGETTWFQVFHRNAPNSFCFSDSLAGTNWSNGMIIHWGAP